MKFAKLMESRFHKTLLINFGVAALVLVIYGFITIRQTQEKATAFIFSHISQIAQAEVSAQSIADIDREVGQLYGAWKATQDFDIRIDVFLNEKLVGHAGELQQLSPLSVTKIKKFVLPSGQQLALQIDLDVTGHVLFVSLILLILIGFLAATFLMIRRSTRESARAISKPLEDKVRFVTAVAQGLPGSVHQEFPKNSSSIEEISELDCALKTLFAEISNLESCLVSAAVDKGRLEMAEEVAHNLKSALAVIQLRIENSSGISQSDRKHLRESVADLANISRRFIKSPVCQQVDILPSQEPRIFDFAEAVEKVISSKAEQYRDHHAVSITYQDNLARGCAIAAPEPEFLAMLGNIIDNSVEALNGNGLVQITTNQGEQSVLLTIRDNGVGIPEDVLPKLMEYRATFGKEDGNGLGLFHAKKLLASIDGKIEIESKINTGTCVSISMPTFRQPDLRTIEIVPSQTIVILDDEECIHLAWKLKLKEFENCVSIHHLKSPEEFENWIGVNGLGEPGSRLYLSDFDLKSNARSGLDLIEKYQIQFESFLVTGMSKDRAVADRARKLKLRVIQKDDLHLVKVKVAEQVLRDGEIAN